MRKVLLFLMFLSILNVGFVNAQNITFEKNGSAIIENSTISIRVSARSAGIEQWKYKITGFEMVDVLYGQTDYLKGHLLSEIWDPVTIDLIPAGRPDYGNFYVSQGVSVNKEKNVSVIRQISEASYRLTRDIIVRNDLSVIEARITLVNLSGIPVGSSLRLHNILSPGARGMYQNKNDILFLKTDKGILELDQSLNLENFYQLYGNDKFFNKNRENEPPREWVNPRVVKTPILEENWAVWVNKETGDGMVFVVDGDAFLGYYNCPGITIEPISKAFSLKPGDIFQITVYIGSFTGIKNRKVSGANPLFIELEKLKVENGFLTGTVLPLWKGSLEIISNGKIIQKISVESQNPIEINSKLDQNEWLIKAIDSQNHLIGEFENNGKISLSKPLFEFPEKRKPKVMTKVFLAHNQKDSITSFLKKRDFTVYCSNDASEIEKNIAKEISKVLGAGLAMTNPGGKILLVGNPQTSSMCKNIGIWKNSVDATWPGREKGAILFYNNYEETQQPVLLITGSDEKGVVNAYEKFRDEFLKNIVPPTGFDFWIAGQDTKVFRYTRKFGNETAETLKVKCAKGEYESAQIVITAYEDLENIEVVVEPLVSIKTGKEIVKKYETQYRRKHGPLWVRWVNYYPLGNSPYFKQGVAEQFPDPLLERPETRIEEGNSQPLWLTVIIPEGAEEGLYRSSIRCRAKCKSETIEKIIPIEVEVWNFVVPKNGLGGHPYMSLKNISSDADRTLRKKDIEEVVQNFVEHGMRILHLGPEGMIRWHFNKEGNYKNMNSEWTEVSSDGKVLMDASYFDWLITTIDEAAKPFSVRYMVYIQNLLSNGYGPDTGYFEFTKILPDRFANLPKREGHYYNSYYVEEMLVLFRKHLEKKNWLERVIIKISDEPVGFNAWWNNFTLAARNAGIPFTTAFNNIDWKDAEKGLGVVKEWKPLYMLYNEDFFKKARQSGDKIGWYNCGPPPRISVRATASEIRSYMWQAAKADLDFVSWWGIQNWNYYSHPEIWLQYSHWNSVVYPEHPEKPRWLKKGKGWVDTAPVDSMRWELIREGMEDAWYVNLARSLIAEARKKGLEKEAERSEQVLQNIWADIFPTLNDYKPEYRRILDAREKVAYEILSLQQTLKK